MIFKFLVITCIIIFIIILSLSAFARNKARKNHYRSGG